ncbi:hypothetical protein TraAM80_06847 [Trypanosoma rangeli]|uniref:Thioredoxin-like fold domain-containing protein n=1 Tax=Trypanosoma rangeli TaxID=5698 RepID=A0A422N8I7_TRYRA|nr:uncharacterized protein TraAM80_06847 [Trypanosoma rangeli]RNF01761.1 hypothetical protein TraAM80_06847 [Trypanosoma rangeli]|eukprot:RNF01761.1 hypothetical protein TraAM80_06847 [Trypanosoma rangeli]
MFPSGLVVPTLATATVVTPMTWVCRAAQEQKHTPRRLMPSVRESTLISLVDALAVEAPASKSTAPPAPPAGPAKTLTATGAETTINANVSVITPAVAPSLAPPLPKPQTAPTPLPRASWKSHPLTAAFTTTLEWASLHSLIALGATAAVGFALLKVYSAFARSIMRRRMMSIDDSKKLQLYVVPRSYAIPGVSAPCVAVDIFLRMAKVPYEVHTLDDPLISPTGKLPLIRYKGNCLDATDAIIAFVTSAFNVKVDNYLTEREKAIGVALETLAKHCSWWSYECLSHNERRSVVRVFLVKMLRKVTMSDETLTQRAMLTRQEEDLQAIEKFIGNKKYLLGSTPTSYDCALYALLVPLVSSKADGPAAYMANSRVLKGYVKRMSNFELTGHNGGGCLHQWELALK